MKNLSARQRFILFNTWSGAIDRCHNPRNGAYANYGARGITVCDLWRNSFDAFVSAMGARPDGTSLDRIDVNKGYSPDNCRWADRFTQARNKRNTKLAESDLRDILNAAQEGYRAEAIAAFYGVSGAHIRKITEDVRPTPLSKGTPAAKVTEAQVVEIRARYAAGEKPAALAEAFGMKPRNVFNIVKGHTWKFVE